jgi:Dolichyl-phosphate-mannose-protein mannosyltransferase
MMTVEAFGRRAERHPIVSLVAVIGLSVILPTVLAALTGNLAIPHNDAWAYSLIAEHFARTGVIRLVGWNNPFSVGQAVVLGPLGTAIVAQQLFVAVLAVVALGATFLLLSSYLSRPRAVFGVAVVAAFPGFGLLSTSFMGDVPTYCAIIGTLLIGRLAIERHSLTRLAVAVAIGLWGFTVREQAIAACVCVLISAFVTWTDNTMRHRVVALAGIAAAVAIILEAWRRSLANGQTPTAAVHPIGGAVVCAEAMFTFGLLLLPAAAATVRPSSWSTPARWAAVLTGAAGVVLLARSHELLLGNYLDVHGPYSEVLLGTRRVLPAGIWGLLKVGAWVGGILVAGELVDGFRRLDRSLGLFGLLTVLGIAFEALTGQSTFDRFLLPLLPVGIIVILGGDDRHEMSTTRAIAASASLAALFAASLVMTVNGLALDHARWNAAQSVVRTGVKPSQIDAGLEWVGYHYPGPAVDARRTMQRAALPWYAQTLFPRAPECYVLTSSAFGDLGRLVEIFHYRTYLAFGHSRLLLYDTGRCATTPAESMATGMASRERVTQP